MRNVKVIAVVAVVCAVVGIATFVAVSLGWTEPVPDIKSTYAQRAADVDAVLRLGMTRAEVKRIFDRDARNFKADTVSSFGWHCSGCGDYWSQELDLNIFDERPRFSDTHGIGWIVRTRFDPANKLVQHSVRPDGCCYRTL